jgi:hypothetical protein
MESVYIYDWEHNESSYYEVIKKEFSRQGIRPISILSFTILEYLEFPEFFIKNYFIYVLRDVTVGLDRLMTFREKRSLMGFPFNYYVLDTLSPIIGDIVHPWVLDTVSPKKVSDVWTPECRTKLDNGKFGQFTAEEIKKYKELTIKNESGRGLYISFSYFSSEPKSFLLDGPSGAQYWDHMLFTEFMECIDTVGLLSAKSSIETVSVIPSISFLQKIVADINSGNSPLFLNMIYNRTRAVLEIH